MPAPAPKVKMSNLMRVLGSHATSDPTKMEAEVGTALPTATIRPRAHARGGARALLQRQQSCRLAAARAATSVWRITAQRGARRRMHS
jgi:U4/U6 small nuclear ribonucleoprotein PRP3